MPLRATKNPRPAAWRRPGLLPVLGLAATLAVIPAVPAAAAAPATAKSGETVLAWGSNFYGELGDGTTTDSTDPVRVHLRARDRSPDTGLKISNGGCYRRARGRAGDDACAYGVWK
jgi:hypothetical protein